MTLRTQCAATLCPTQCVGTYCYKHRHRYRTLTDREKRELLERLGVYDDEEEAE